MRPMGRAVLLLHEGGGPGAGTHYDWVIEREPGGPLVSFRVFERIDRGGTGFFEAGRRGDHGGEYLDWGGEGGGGRGQVGGGAEGELRIGQDGGGRFLAEGWLGGAQGRFEGVEGEG